MHSIGQIISEKTLTTRNTFCRTRSLSNATFFHFDHVTFIQFKICCCVQNFIKILWFFTEIWRYIDFQNSGRSPYWNCFTTMRDYPRSLCCWPQLPVKFHGKLIHISEDVLLLRLLNPLISLPFSNLSTG